MTHTAYRIKPQLFSLECKVPCDMALPTFEPHPMPIPFTLALFLLNVFLSYLSHGTYCTFYLEYPIPSAHQSLLKTQFRFTSFGNIHTLPFPPYSKTGQGIIAYLWYFFLYLTVTSLGKGV